MSVEALTPQYFRKLSLHPKNIELLVSLSQIEPRILTERPQFDLPSHTFCEMIGYVQELDYPCMEDGVMTGKTEILNIPCVYIGYTAAPGRFNGNYYTEHLESLVEGTHFRFVE